MAVDFLVLGPSIGNAKNLVIAALRPLGVHKVAWIARQHGYNALAISKLQLLSEDEIFDLCKHFVGPKTLIGVSTTLIAIPNFSERQAQTNWNPLTNFINAVKRLKALHNNKILIGGQLSHRHKERFEADYVISGLSVENDIVKFLDGHFRRGVQKKPYNWDIKTCDFRWHETDFIQHKELLPIETSRGCIFKCTFCGYSEIGRKKGTFEKDINLLKEYIVENYEKYGTTSYTLADDTFNDDDERMQEWCEMLETLPFKIRYGGYVRADLFDRYQDTAKRLYKNGLSGFSFGIETFHPEAARAIGKSFSAKKGKKFLDYAWEELFEKNVFIITTNLVGLPGESLESSDDMHRWYKERPHIFTIWSGVFLTKNTDTMLTHSEFSKHPELYGYQFKEGGNDYEWYNEHMTYDEAVKKGLEFGRESNTPILDCWTHLSYFAFEKIQPKDYWAMTREEQLNFKKRLDVELHKLNFNYFDAVRKYGESQ
jgi:radical SAM superfamily enzyme YgiQ (UPF0313 family)